VFGGLDCFQEPKLGVWRLFMRVFFAMAIAAGAVAPAGAQDQHQCPMMGGDRQAAVDHRHEDASGVPSAAVRHHFLLARDGGSILLEATDPADTTTRDAVRTHLRAIARSFTAGDFSTPAHVHGQVPPGVEGMKARAPELHYAYADTADGGTVTITTADGAARAAVHEFLRFQIRDHGTGDPVE
jgi:hypothetical protein